MLDQFLCNLLFANTADANNVTSSV